MVNRISIGKSLIAAMLLGVYSCSLQEQEAPIGLSVNVEELYFSKTTGAIDFCLTCGEVWDIVEKPDWIEIQSIVHSQQNLFEWFVSVVPADTPNYDREGFLVIKANSHLLDIYVFQEGKKGRYIAVESVRLSSTSLVMTEGESTTISYTIQPSNASEQNVTWSSSAPYFASVSNSGRISALSEGTATIRVTTDDGGKTATCSVTVKSAKIAVTGVSLNKSSLSMKKGDTQSLTATVTPSNATDKSVIWSSSSTSVATVSSSGLVTAKSAGTATITVKTNEGGKTATCTVTVTQSGLEAVDLGLSVKWASTNVGAANPWDYGDYFAWGEIQAKSSYNWANYKWCNGSSSSLTKYNTSSSYGTVDNKTVLVLSDDAAHANWGGNWRMPTDSEWSELLNHCSWKWTLMNGFYGITITGTNGNSIFLPAGGYRDGTTGIDADSWGDYWTSSLNSNYPYRGWYVNFSSGGPKLQNTGFSRYYGFSIRPVTN